MSTNFSSRTVVDFILCTILSICIVGVVWAGFTQPIFVLEEPKPEQKIVYIKNIIVNKPTNDNSCK